MLKSDFMVMIFILVDAFLLAAGVHFGMLDVINRDTSYITHSIFVLYALSNLLFFFRGYKLIGRGIEWISIALPGLGLMGTTVGFYMIFNGLFDGTISLEGVDNVMQVLGKLSVGLSVALLSTASGIGTLLMHEFKKVWL